MKFNNMYGLNIALHIS